jgi:hypothetical protein
MRTNTYNYQLPNDAAPQTYARRSHTNDQLLHFCIVNMATRYPKPQPTPVTSSGDIWGRKPTGLPTFLEITLAI